MNWQGPLNRFELDNQSALNDEVYAKRIWQNDTFDFCIDHLLPTNAKAALFKHRSEQSFVNRLK